MPVHVAGPNGGCDVELVIADHQVTLAEVFAAVGLETGDATVDGERPADPSTCRALDVLAPGSRLASGDAAGRHADEPARETGRPEVEMAIVAGPGAGDFLRMPLGRHRIGDRERDATSRLYVAVDAVRGSQGGPRPWHEVGRSIEAVEVGDNVLALGPAIDSEAGYPGFVHRPPRRVPPTTVGEIAIPTVPKPVSPPQPLSWATLLAPIPVAVVMAMFFRPIFAVFAAMGPLVAVGRWVEGRRRFRRESIDRNRFIAGMRASLDRDVSRQVEEAAELRWIGNPHVAELWRRTRVASVRLWERRSGSPGYMVATVGTAPDEILAVTDGTEVAPELGDALGERLALRPVPHVVDLAAHQGLGVHGPRDEALALVRSVLLQLVTLQGPADLEVVVVCADDRERDWDWLKWLPHVVPELVGRPTEPAAVGRSAPEAGRTAAAPGGDDTGPVRLIVVDDPTCHTSEIVQAATGSGRLVRLLAVAERSTLLPAGCSSLVAVRAGQAEISTPELGGRRSVVRASTVSRPAAVGWARALARLRDPEAPDLMRQPGGAATLFDLVGFTTPTALADRWHARSPAEAPRIAVGTAGERAFVLDLVADGPHALVAGTTGSGKSELLRTMVVALAAACPPQQLNFVLVDFKGGGAFDICGRLPHIAGSITDLDEGLVGRAISSLRSELVRRERILRELGTASYDEAAVVSDRAIARLVVVVDEFAALAPDHPELMASIVDLAARGRSLGMHLVLATQRPNGVVDQKIRANTNLRIALRVQDAFDSHDVVGVPDAALIDRKHPGRAIVRIGGDAPVAVQTAFSGAPDPRASRVSVRPFRLFAERDGGSLPPEADASPARDSQLEILVDAIESAAAARGYVPAPLWAEPLPDELDWIDLGTRVLSRGDGEAEGLALGLVDMPEVQMQSPWRWDPSSGALAFVGASARCAGKAIVSIGAAIAAASGPDGAHLYVIDGDAGWVEPLRGLPHTGAYIRRDELDRIERVVDLFDRLMTGRRAAAQRACSPATFLMIDNLAAVLAGFEDLAAAALVERLGALARDGAPLGVHLVVSARTGRDLTHRLGEQIPHRLVLALADPAGYLALGLRNRDLVALPAMRAIDLATSRVVQLVEPPELATVCPRLTRSGADVELLDPAMAPVPIGTVPTSLDIEAVPPASRRGDVLVIPLGVDAADLGEASLELGPGEHALVVGPAGSGRSSTLVAVATQIDRLGSCSIHRLGAAGSPLLDAEVPGSRLDGLGALEAIAGTAEGPVPTPDHVSVLLVDDAERLAPRITEALANIVEHADPGIRIVAAVPPDAARSIRAWTAPIRSRGIGIVLGGAPTDGDVLGARLTRLAGLGSIPGRGHLVRRGRVTPAHFATAKPPARAG